MSETLGPWLVKKTGKLGDALDIFFASGMSTADALTVLNAALSWVKSLLRGDTILSLNHEQAVAAFQTLLNLEALAQILTSHPNKGVRAQAYLLLSAIMRAKAKFEEREDYPEIEKRSSSAFGTIFQKEFPCEPRTLTATKAR